MTERNKKVDQIKNFIYELRKEIGHDEEFQEIVFDEPNDIILWLEELCRWDIIRSKDGIQKEKGSLKIDDNVTKLTEKTFKRLAKLMELKSKLGLEGKLTLSPADMKVITED